MMQKIRKTICPLDCPDSCALIATIENDEVVSLQGDPDHKITQGFICRKMRNYHQRLNSNERVLYPLLRTGKKGEGAFKRISWDETWQILVERLTDVKKKYGGEALLPFHYAGNMGHVSGTAGDPFFNRYGASQLDATICSSAAKAGWRAQCGDRPGRDPEEASRAKTIVAWGINIKVTNIHFWPLIQKSRREGGKLIVIDPYRNVTAKAADHYFQVKPGGDVALALGTLKIIVEEKAENASFIETRTTGFETYKAYIESLSWQQLESASGISKAEMELLSQLLLEDPRVFIRIGVGLSRNTQGAMSVRAICCLAMALGLFENKAGQGVLLSSGAFKANGEKLSYSSLREKETRTINMVQLGHALTALEPKVKALFVFNSNPLSVTPDAGTVKSGLAREDLFTIVHEQVMTPTARYADLLLPATTMFESKDIYNGYGHFYLGMIDPIVPVKGEAIDNFTLFQMLAEKMGYNEPPFKQSLSERIQDYLEDIKGIPDDYDLSGLEPGQYIKSFYAEAGNHPLEDTPFTFVSDTLDAGQPPFPSLLPKLEFEDPDLQSRYPLKLITPPNGNLLNSTFGERYQGNLAEVLIHPKDAKPRGIQSGGIVCLVNHRSSVKRIAKITEDTQPGLLVAEGIYWEVPEKGFSGINELASQKITDLGRGGTFHESLVEVAPV